MIEVLLLTAPGCHWCADADALLTRLAGEFDLRVTKRDVGSSDQDLLLAHGALFPPALFVDGAFVQYGRPSEKRIRAALAAVAKGRA